MNLTEFKYHRPKSISEACSILQQSKNGALLAGGTDLLVEIKQGLRHNEDIISLSDIENIKGITEKDTEIEIGACATHNDVLKSTIIKEKFPALSEAASKIGTHQIRNKGTIGGNLCTGASCCDMAPVLIALDAKAEITDSVNIRVVSLKDFFIFHKETAMKKGEIMTKIIIPLPKRGFGASFEKFGLREAASISVATVSVSILSDSNNCRESCVVIGAVAPTPRISHKAIDILNGKKLDELLDDGLAIKSVGEAAVKDALPIDDIRGSAEFRRSLIKSLTRRAVKKAVIRSMQNLKQPNLR